MTIAFQNGSDPAPGLPVEVAPQVRRLTAPNAGPFTFRGTNTYLVGDRDLVLIDPGPDDDVHLDAILRAMDGARLEAILLTHTHLDHSGLLTKLHRATGAPPVYAEGEHRAARVLHEGEVNSLDAASDKAFRPDRRLADGESVEFAAGRFEAVATPGHTENHLAFALDGHGLLFSGDHVMGWSTTIVAPPDGSMRRYMQSLDKLMERSEGLYLPGHGDAIDNPLPYMRGLRSHRRMREATIVERIAAGDGTIAEIVANLYRKTDPRLHRAAALSVLSHLEDLVERGLVLADGPPLLETRYRTP